ncbi:MAG: phosphate acetyltransferase [Deltaproteobacteria bacterium]|nr:phosphate acetyltransferase [Deltaproteobacteria bacterium]
MPQNLYIATIEPGSGKSLVALSMMVLLSSRVRRLGFFRPVIRESDSPDNDIELVRRRCELPFAYESLFATTHEEARDRVAAGQYEELIKHIFSRYKALEKECDFVVCEGTDFTGVSSAFEFDFNARLAKHLGAPILAVVNGREKHPDHMVGLVGTTREAFHELGCSIAATIVNRVAPGHASEIARRLTESHAGDDPVWVIPEDEALGKPTVATVASELQAELLFGDWDRADLEVLDCQVAAMEVANFLDHLRAGSLVVTSGDRADIILACFSAAMSPSYPHIVGMILSGGLKPSPQVLRLIESLGATSVPIFGVEEDTFTAATRINAVRAVIAPTDERKVASALALFEESIDRSELERRIAVSKPTSVTPIMFEHEILERAGAQRQHIVLPEAMDDRILLAAEILRRRGIVDLTLLGSAANIGQRMAALGVDGDGLEIIDPAESAWLEEFASAYRDLRKHKGITLDVARDTMLDINYFGTMMIHTDRADGMVSGAAHPTGQTMRPAFEIVRTRPGRAIVSSVFLMCLEDRVLAYGDCAINPNPSSEQLADIAISSAETAQTFGIEPRVAMLSYSTGESGRGTDVDQVREATRLARKLRPDLQIEGPIQYDAAVDASVARKKLPESEVAGHATVFIFPDLNTGNNTYKAVQRSAGAVAIGPVIQGLNKPINDLSRGCSVNDIVNTVAITAIQAQASRSDA